MPPIDSFIFIPAYNVESTLAATLERIRPAVWKRSRVLVIDDGSTDGTQKVFEEFRERTHEKNILRYIRFEKNQGYGAVVKKGIAEGIASGAKFVACLHGDGQYPGEQLGEFFAAMAIHDLALLQGSRMAIEGEAKDGGMPLHKRIGGAILTAIENLAFRQPLTDRHSGFLVYSTAFLKTLDLEKLSGSFDIDLEIIAKADAAGFPMAELPIPTHYGNEKSHLNVVTYGLRVLLQVVRRFFA
ncbi:glycosyltransferase family 2 protein [Fibrobacter sp.]|uniref:glycosyltransferase family 2 protein n=1 Tax=Fibrobacter sp. TaxID=35828 RepID=UPI0025BD3E47|nr:glycosyltransferase family 2 protein [Fibrobacter sp.]